MTSKQLQEIADSYRRLGGIEELEKLKEEITEYRMKINAGNDEFHVGRLFGCDEMVEIINNHISELKGD